MSKAKAKSDLPKPKSKTTRSKPRGRQTSSLSSVIRARIDPDLKARAEQVLDSIGLKPSEAIRLFYAQIDLTHGIPFPVKIPNAETIAAMQDAETGHVTRHANPAELFDKLGI